MSAALHHLNSESLSAARCQSLTSSEPVVSRPGESVTLSCKIRQKAEKGLEWIGRIDSGTGTIFAQSLQGQFSITKYTSQNVVYLVVNRLKQEDSAVYYCTMLGYFRFYFDSLMFPVLCV
uniref:Ig-like domain-containing protein n=1 Tax=Amphilophus citrinellus TaxID=61819 RepID=A0A3Q0T5B3_AMPCI